MKKNIKAILGEKAKLVVAGMDGKLAEEVIAKHDDYEKAIEFYRRGWTDPYVLDRVLSIGWSVEYAEALLRQLMEKGLSKKQAMQELVYAVSYCVNEETLEQKLEYLKQEDIKTLTFLSFIQDTYIPSEVKDNLRKRKDFYQSLGLSEVEAEWWSALETYFGQELTKETFFTLYQSGTRYPIEIHRALYELSEEKKIRIAKRFSLLKS